MPLITIGPSAAGMPIGSDDAIAFHTFRGYLEAVCAWATALHPHPDGLVAGVAQSVKVKPWRLKPSLGKRLSP